LDVNVENVGLEELYFAMFSAEGQWSFFIRSLDLMSSHYLIGTLLMQSAASRNNAKLVLDEKKMISNRFILITNRAFYSSSPFSKCSFVLLQITEWKQKYCETRNDWRTLPISHLSV
jgi:hypothetical protein